METYTEVKPRINFSVFAENFHGQIVSGDLGGLTLLPGIYKATEAVYVKTGDLILDAEGNENAVWIFQFASDFFTIGGSGGNIILTGNAKAQNVFWQTEHLANIGDGTSFKGNILAKMIDGDIQPITVESQPIKSKGRAHSKMGWPLYGQRL